MRACWWGGVDCCENGDCRTIEIMYGLDINMNEESTNSNSLDLSGLDFGPQWARKGDQPKKNYKEYKGSSKEGRKPFKGGRNARTEGGYKGARKEGGFKPRKPRPIPAQAAEGISGAIMPVEEGVDNLAKEITASGRTYSVFDLARAVLGSRDRFNIVFSKDEKGPEMFQSKKDDSVFLSQDECLQYAATTEWFGEIFQTEEIEVDPPKGNFQTIAKCGFSGVLLGPTNFHGYQEKVQALHAADFANMSLENYKRRIVTESGEEIVNLWKESMTKRVVFKLVADATVVLDTQAAAIQYVAANLFDEHFRKTHKAQVPSGIEAKKMSPGLLTTLKEVIQDQRRYPGALSSFLCRQLSGRQLAVFKWQGKLHSGPSRPHQIPEDVVLAERMTTIFQWIEKNQGGGVDVLWKDVCPEGIEEEDKLKWYHDLHWLINQGHVIFMNSGYLFTSTASKKPTKKPAEPKKGEKAKKPKSKQDKKPEKKVESTKVTAAAAEAKVDAKIEVSEPAAEKEQPKQEKA